MSKLDSMLAEASRNTIAELYAMDPFQYTKHDIDCIIEYYREKRTQYVATGKGMPRIEKATLEDLGL